MINEEELRNALQGRMTDADLQDSTIQSLSQFVKLLSGIDQSDVRTVAAIGSGKGVLCAALADLYDTSEAYAVDIDENSLAVASERGLITHCIDVESDPLPMDNGEIDLVLCMGLLEHLTWYDHVISEIRRIVSEAGHCLFALPNLAGWTNRVSLLSGHQPRNVEFSREKPFGILGIYGADTTVSHIHAPTVGAFSECLEHYDLQTKQTVGLYPYQRGWIVKLVDALFSRRPSLCRRFGVLAVPNSSPS